MSSAEALQRDLAQIGTFIRTADPAIRVAVQTSQFTAYKARVAGLKDLSPHAATNITQIINDGPWTVDEKGAFATQLCERLTLGNKPSSNRRAMQDLTSFNNYLTTADVDIIKSAAHLHLKLLRVWNAVSA